MQRIYTFIKYLGGITKSKLQIMNIYCVVRCYSRNMINNNDNFSNIFIYINLVCAILLYTRMIKVFIWNFLTCVVSGIEVRIRLEVNRQVHIILQRCQHNNYVHSLSFLRNTQNYVTLYNAKLSLHKKLRHSLFNVAARRLYNFIRKRILLSKILGKNGQTLKS